MTAQIHERLILDGEETSMAYCPPLPDDHPRIFEPDPDQVMKDDEDSILGSTACWRGYQSTWEIKEGRFYLVGLRGHFQIREGGPILADWFSGVLRIPKGDVLRYVHIGFDSVYEQEIRIKIEKGAVVSRRVIHNRGRMHKEQR